MSADDAKTDGTSLGIRQIHYGEQEGREFTEALIDTIREGLLVLDADLQVVAANGSFYRMFEVSEKETEGKLVYGLGNGQWDIPGLRELLEEVLPQEKTIEAFEVTHDFENISERTMLLNARQLDDVRLILLSIEDVSERRQAERGKRQSEERYRLLVESAREYAIFLLDADGRITSWNHGAERIFGYTAEEAVGQPGAIIFTEEQRAAGVPEAETATATREGRASDERWHVRKDGSRFWASGMTEAVSNGELPGFSKVLRDNTERKQAEEALRHANETLEARVRERTKEVWRLASQLTLAESRERGRIAQTLHDELQQQLYALQFPLSKLKKNLARQNEASTAPIKQIDSILKDAIRMTREVTSDLSPPVLRGEGLSEALRWLANSMSKRFGLTVEMTAGPDLSVPNEAVRSLLFSLVRELLFNVAKHANVSRAEVHLRETKDRLEIVVRDEGVGFNTGVLEGGGTGLGLASADQRLKLFGGDIRIESEAGKGTRVTILMPLASLTLS